MTFSKKLKDWLKNRTWTYNNNMAKIIVIYHSMAERQVIVLGRHSDMSIGWFLSSYVTRAAQEAGAAAELAASHTLEKYANIDSRYLFEPLLRLKLWASSTLQLVASRTILVRGWLSSLARLEIPASCISASRSWYSVITRCCSTMVCPMTPRTDVPVLCFLLNF